MYFPEEIVEEERKREEREREKIRIFQSMYRKNERLSKDKLMIYTCNNLGDEEGFYFVNAYSNKIYWCYGGEFLLDNEYFGKRNIYPKHVPFFDDKKIKKISVEKSHRLFLLHDGTVFGIGENLFGELCLVNLIKTYFELIKTVFIKFFAPDYFEKQKEEEEKEEERTRLLWLYLNPLKHKKIVVYDQNSKKSVKIKDIFIGENTSFFISEDNKAYAGGLNTMGQLGVGDLENRNFADEVKIQEGVLSITSLDNNTMFLTMSGKVYIFGNSNTTPWVYTQGFGDSKILKIFNGKFLTSFLTENNEVYSRTTFEDYDVSLERNMKDVRRKRRRGKMKRIVNIKGGAFYTILLSEINDKSFYLISLSLNITSRYLEIPTVFSKKERKDIQLECLRNGWLWVSKNKIVYRGFGRRKRLRVVGNINIKSIGSDYWEKEEKKARFEYLYKTTKDVDEYTYKKKKPEKLEMFFSKLK